MYYIDVKYLKLISGRLPKFQSQKDGNWKCRCILCGDSKRNENKTRGYFYKKKEKLVYHCFNCGITKSLYDFIKDLDPELHKEYVFELYKERKSYNEVEKKEEKLEEKIEPKKPECILDHLMDRLDTLPEDNIAVKYCIDRKIPSSAFKKLYFIDDIRKVVQLNEKYKESLTIEEPRLFIPFYDTDGILVGGTMRALRGEARRYVTVKIKEDVPYIFGIVDADSSKTLYVVEGPFDSLFLDNAIAVSGSTLSKVRNLSDRFSSIVYVYDNQPHNNEICNLIKRQIDKGDSVVIWPSHVIEKDINEMILVGRNVQSIVQSNIVSGISAKLKFNQWKRC